MQLTTMVLHRCSVHERLSELQLPILTIGTLSMTRMVKASSAITSTQKIALSFAF